MSLVSNNLTFLNLPTDTHLSILPFIMTAPSSLPKAISNNVAYNEHLLKPEHIQLLDDAHKLAEEFHSYGNFPLVNRWAYDFTKEIRDKIVDIIESLQKSSDGLDCIEECVKSGWYLSALTIYFVHRPEALSIRFRSIDSGTVLHCAISPKDGAFSSSFLSSILKINRAQRLGLLKLEDSRGFRPIHTACDVESVSKDCIQMLLEHDPDCIENINSLAPVSAVYGHKEGVTPIYLLCRKRKNDCVEMIKVLQGHGANINRRNEYGNTALHQAACLESDEVSQQLLTCGADPRRHNNYKETAEEIRDRYPRSMEKARAKKDKNIFSLNLQDEFLKYGPKRIRFSQFLHKEFRELMEMSNRSLINSEQFLVQNPLEFNPIQLNLLLERQITQLVEPEPNIFQRIWRSVSGIFAKE